MTARAPVYIDSGKLHVFEDGDTLPPWLSPSSMAWENLTGVPAGITQLADLTGPGYAKIDAAGAWSVQAAIPQADVSGLSTALAGLQPISARLTAIAGLTDAAGWLHDDGSGAWSISVPTASQVGAEAALGSPATSGYLLSSTSAGVRSWVAPYSLLTATASVLGGVKVGAGLAISSGALSVSYGTAAGTACAGNDSRLSDSRTPTAHVLDGALHTISGKTAGQVLVATGATTFGFATISGDAALSGAGALTLATLLTAGSAGSAASVPTLTWDAKGRLTAVGSAAISIPHTQISDWGTYINQALLTTSSPTFGTASLGVWSYSSGYAWFGASGQNNLTNGSSGFLQSSTGDKSVYMCAPANGYANITYNSQVYLIIGASGVSMPDASGLTVSGLIKANGGISGNLTGHASLDIPLTGSAAITGSLISSNASNLGSASLPWGSVYGTTLYEGGVALSSKYLSSSSSSSLNLYGLILNNGGLSVQGTSLFMNKVTMQDDLTACYIKSWTITPRNAGNDALGSGSAYWWGTYTNRLFCAIDLNAPSTATDVGIAGRIVFGSSYVYVCTATNTWRRAALATW